VPRGRFKHLPWLWRIRPVSRIHCLKNEGQTFAGISLQAAQKLFLTGPPLFKGIGFPLLERNGSSYRSADGPVRTCTLLIDAHSCTDFELGSVKRSTRRGLQSIAMSSELVVTAKCRGFTEFDQVPNLRLLSTSF